jgi:hypothetical protein
MDHGAGMALAAWSEAAARTNCGGGLVNRGGRQGLGDAARLTSGAGWQHRLVSAAGCGR